MRGRFLRRYQRFLVDIETETGEVITAFCPATGRLRTCSKVGAPVEYTDVKNEDRRTDFDWWSIRMPASWVVVDTRPANQLIYQHRRSLACLSEWADEQWTPEPVLEDGSRLDYKIGTDLFPTWVEIKSVTWCENGVGYFPDAPSERASRHLEELIDRSTEEAALLILVAMRSDIHEIRPATEVDPAFARRLKRARENGVEIMGIGSRVTHRSVTPFERIPVNLE